MFICPSQQMNKMPLQSTLNQFFPILILFFKISLCWIKRFFWFFFMIYWLLNNFNRAINFLNSSFRLVNTTKQHYRVQTSFKLGRRSIILNQLVLISRSNQMTHTWQLLFFLFNFFFLVRLIELEKTFIFWLLFHDLIRKLSFLVYILNKLVMFDWLKQIWRAKTWFFFFFCGKTWFLNRI